MRPTGGRRSVRHVAAVTAVVAVAAVAVLGQRCGIRDRAGDSTDAIAQAFADRRSGVMVDAAGVVERVLPDDREGSRHQRFILAVGGHTVLVAHNIDLAPRVPLAVGDSVALRGQYEWTAPGGTVHWTHHDPDGTHPGGWILHEGRRFE